MLTETILTAISQRRKLKLKLSSDHDANELIEVLIKPHLLGEDVLKNKFIWGFLPETETFYKMPIVLIVDADFSDAEFIGSEGTSPVLH